LQNGIIIIKC